MPSALGLIVVFSLSLSYAGAPTVFWSIDLPSPGGADPILEWALQMANTDNRKHTLTFLINIAYYLFIYLFIY